MIILKNPIPRIYEGRGSFPGSFDRQYGPVSRVQISRKEALDWVLYHSQPLFGSCPGLNRAEKSLGVQARFYTDRWCFMRNTVYTSCLNWNVTGRGSDINERRCHCLQNINTVTTVTTFNMKWKACLSSKWNISLMLPVAGYNLKKMLGFHSGLIYCATFDHSGLKDS